MKLIKKQISQNLLEAAKKDLKSSNDIKVEAGNSGLRIDAPSFSIIMFRDIGFNMLEAWSQNGVVTGQLIQIYNQITSQMALSELTTALSELT